ncbi:AlbA family DNA-binding domain-containing protein [Neorhizobium galegae]|uniref:AlbA family DNA-binding domain-containing protein n=1 Tax=Neorhizobium galegae TaxID=399 RepID=UPI0012D4A052|nr:ATP-binding protein [Neorhizobium galegae]
MEWQEFVADGVGAVERLLGKQETLNLEFKSDHPKDPMFLNGDLTTNGRKIIAKELSAFSNSAGGVMVIGVDCRNVGGIDEALKLTPISNLSKAETSVRSAASELLQPRHAEIEVLAIPSTNDQSSGYIVVRVPRSDRRPHRSEAKGQKDYFKRAGTSAFAMEHYDVEDAFKRISAPRLKLEFGFSWGIKTSNNYKMNLVFGVVNEGAVSAKSVTLQLWKETGWTLKPDPSRLSTSVSEFGQRRTFAASADFVVHPDQTRTLEKLQFQLTNLGPKEQTIDGRRIEAGAFSFSYSLGAEDMRPETGEFIMSSEHIDAIRAAIGDGG